MTALSLSRGRPVAIIQGGENDKEIIGLVDEKEKTDPDGDPISILGEDFFRALRTKAGKKLKLPQLTALIEGVKSGELPEDEELEDPFHTALDAFLEQDKKEFKIEDAGVAQVVPNYELERECGYICGPSGSGKSTFVGLYCEQWRKADPEKKIYIFSRVEEDKALDQLKPERIKICDDLVKSPPSPGDFKDSIVIFDDIDTIPDKKQMEATQKIRDDLLETGRHQDVTVLCTSHQLMNYKKTKVMLNEATFVVFFPKSGSTAQIQRYLKDYAGLDKKTKDKILGLPSRWAMHYRYAPQYILHEKGAFTL